MQSPSPKECQPHEPTDTQALSPAAVVLAPNEALDQKSEIRSELLEAKGSEIFQSSFRPDIRACGKSHFQITFLFIPGAAKRSAAADLYSFCRLVDDIADEAHRSVTQRKELLQQVRDWIVHRPKLGHSFWDRWAEEIRTFHIPAATLLAIVNGVARDLENRPFTDWSDLEDYMQGVASAVGEAFLAIVDRLDQEAYDYSFHMGRALQYLNILRDLKTDALQGRRYIPDTMDKHLVESQEALRRELFSRALFHRHRARPKKSWGARLAYLPAELMAKLYFYAAEQFWIRGDDRRLNGLQSLWALLSKPRW